MAKHEREIDEKGEETVERSLEQAMKVHKGHMERPNKPPSKASAAKEMRLMKKARSSFEKHEEKEEHEEEREDNPGKGKKKRGLLIIIGTKHQPRLPTRAAKDYVS